MACCLFCPKPLFEPMLAYWSIGPLGTNFSKILIEVQIFSFKKMNLKMSSVKWRPFCPGLNVLTWLPAALTCKTIFNITTHFCNEDHQYSSLTFQKIKQGYAWEGGFETGVHNNLYRSINTLRLRQKGHHFANIFICIFGMKKMIVIFTLWCDKIFLCIHLAYAKLWCMRQCHFNKEKIQFCLQTPLPVISHFRFCS